MFVVVSWCLSPSPPQSSDGDKKISRLLLTFGRVLSRLGKVQTSLPLLSLFQNLRGRKKSRIFVRG